MTSHADLLPGTLDLLILKTLQLDPMHGWGITLRIQQISRDVLKVNQGSLYPALHRLEQQGLIGAEWGASENNRKARYYCLTVAGRRQLKLEPRIGSGSRRLWPRCWRPYESPRAVPAEDRGARFQALRDFGSGAGKGTAATRAASS